MKVEVRWKSDVENGWELWLEPESAAERNALAVGLASGWSGYGTPDSVPARIGFSSGGGGSHWNNCESARIVIRRE